MATYTKQLQAIFHEYEAQHGGPGSLREAVEWGIREGRLATPTLDPIGALVHDLKGALRAEIRVDDEGREYRANAAVTFTDGGGVQGSFWGDVDRKTTPDNFLIEHYAQRRKGIVDDCAKLKEDVDHFNATRTDRKPIQLILDFTDDVAEREAMRAVDAAE